MKKEVSTSMDFRAFEATPGIHVVVHADPPSFTIAAVSEDFLRWSGHTRDSLTGKSYFQTSYDGLNKKEQEKSLRSMFQQVVAEKAPVEKLIPSAPTKRSLKIRNVPLLDDAGDVIFIIHAVTFIDESRKEQSAEASKGIERAYQFFMQAPVIIGFLRGDDYHIELANERLLKVWKRTDSVIGNPLFNEFPELEKQGIRKLLDDVRKTGKPFFAYEFPLVFDVDGREETFYFDFVYHAYYENGNDKIASGVISVGHDVTEKVLARQKFKNVIEQTQNPILILKGEDMIVEAANAALYNIWNADESVVGKPLLDIRPQLKGRGFMEKLQKVYRTGKPYKGFGTPVIRTDEKGDEQTVYLDYTYQPYREANGEIVGVMVVASDATEQVIARTQLEESERRWKQLADTMPVIVWTGDTEGRVKFFNRGWYDMTGLTERESLDFGWTKVLHPDDLESCLEAWAEARDKKIFYQMEVRFRTKDGDYRWMIARSVPIRENGEVIAWYGTSTDINEQKQLELNLEEKVRERTEDLAGKNRLLDNILENSSNGISVSEMILDEEGNVVDAMTILANDAAVSFSGIPRDIYLSKRATELDPGLMTSPYGLACLKTLKTGEPSLMQYYLEFSGKWLELTVSKMDDSHLIHIFTDVTPIKKAQLDLERYLEELKFANANLEEFAYAASHDLKEPIRKIRFFSNRLMESFHAHQTDASDKLFQRLDKSAARMEKLIDDLLEYSQAAKGASSVEAVDLNQLTQGVLEDLELEIQNKQATVTTMPLPVIQGNTRQLQQLFQNLISNALKYGKASVPPVVNIRYKTVTGKDALPELTGEEAGQFYHLIEVSDNGIGFDQHDAERIFNLFTRLRSDVEYRGSGVGLSIVKKVVESHHGFIRARSEIGKGAVFSILLPV